MIEHSCCCIWSFVLSGLNQIQIWFENLLKICFEKLEKEKEKRNSFHPDFGPSRPTLAAARLLPAPCSRVGRAQARPAGPTRARSRSEPLTRGARLSVSPSTFLSSSSRRRPDSPSFFHRSESISQSLSFLSWGRLRAIKRNPVPPRFSLSP
jgi:hypothetical protein